MMHVGYFPTYTIYRHSYEPIVYTRTFTYTMRIKQKHHLIKILNRQIIIICYYITTTTATTTIIIMLLARLLVPACLHLLACFYQDDIDGDNNNKIIRPINKKHKAQIPRARSLSLSLSLSKQRQCLLKNNYRLDRFQNACRYIYVCMCVCTILTSQQLTVFNISYGTHSHPRNVNAKSLSFPVSRHSRSA